MAKALCYEEHSYFRKVTLPLQLLELQYSSFLAPYEKSQWVS